MTWQQHILLAVLGSFVGVVTFRLIGHWIRTIIREEIRKTK